MRTDDLAERRYADSQHPHAAPSPDREIPQRRLIRQWLKPRRVTAHPVTPYPRTYQDGFEEGQLLCARQLEAALAASPDVSETMKTQDRTPPAPEDQP